MYPATSTKPHTRVIVNLRAKISTITVIRISIIWSQWEMWIIPKWRLVSESRLEWEMSHLLSWM